MVSSMDHNSLIHDATNVPSVCIHCFYRRLHPLLAAGLATSSIMNYFAPGGRPCPTCSSASGPALVAVALLCYESGYF